MTGSKREPTTRPPRDDRRPVQLRLGRPTDPGPPAEGDLDEQDVTRLPDDWGEALDRFEASDWAKDWFGEQFCRNYALVKRHEYDDFRRQVPETERARYVEWL